VSAYGRPRGGEETPTVIFGEILRSGVIIGTTAVKKVKREGNEDRIQLRKKAVKRSGGVEL